MKNSERIKNWLLQKGPEEKNLVFIGNKVYSDGMLIAEVDYDAKLVSIFALNHSSKATTRRQNLIRSIANECNYTIIGPHAKLTPITNEINEIHNE